MISTDTSSTQSESKYGRRFQVLIRSAILEDDSLWFPQRLTREYLEDQKKTLGPYLFSAQYLNQHIAPEDRRFEPDWLQYFSGHLDSAEGYHTLVLEAEGYGRAIPVFITTTIDPAISDVKGDFTGIVTVATDPFGAWWVLSARRIRGGAHDIINEIVAELRAWGSAIVGIETVAFQKAIKEFLIDRLREEYLVVSVVEVKSGSGQSKKVRIEGLVPQFAAFKVHLRKGIGPDLETELLSWSPRGTIPHDDLIDALSHQLSVAQPAHAVGQMVLSGDWHDLNPEERRKIKQRQARAYSSTRGLRSGYGGDDF